MIIQLSHGAETVWLAHGINKLVCKVLALKQYLYKLRTEYIPPCSPATVIPHLLWLSPLCHRAFAYTILDTFPHPHLCLSLANTYSAF